MENTVTAENNNVMTTLQVPEGLCRLQVVADFDPYDGAVTSCMYSYDGDGWEDVTSDDEDLRESIKSTLCAKVRDRGFTDLVVHREASLYRPAGQDCVCVVCLGCRHRHALQPPQQRTWVCICVPPKVCACLHCSGQFDDAEQNHEKNREE